MSPSVSMSDVLSSNVKKKKGKKKKDGTIKKMGPILTKLRKCVQSGDHYQALQMYQSVHARSISNGKYKEANKILESGAIELLKAGYIDEGVELATRLVNSWENQKETKKNKDQSTTETSTLSSSSTKNKTSSSNSNIKYVCCSKSHVDILQSIVDVYPIHGDFMSADRFLFKAILWSKKATKAWNGSANVKFGRPEVNAMAARCAKKCLEHIQKTLNERNKLTKLEITHLTEQADRVFSKALGYYLSGEIGNELGEFISEWMFQKGRNTNDGPLLYTRVILTLIARGNLKQANNVRKYISNIIKTKKISSNNNSDNDNYCVDINHPLFNYCELLCLTCERKGKILFMILNKKYQPSLTKDPQFSVLLQNIGMLYFEIKPPQGPVNPMASIMQNFMRGMMQ